MNHYRSEPNTTDLECIKTNAYRFTWGKVVAFHKIGRYELVEYHSFRYERSARTDELEQTTMFHIYVDGKSTSTSSGMLESAIVRAIALGNLEFNEARWMAAAAVKVLGLPLD